MKLKFEKLENRNLLAGDVLVTDELWVISLITSTIEDETEYIYFTARSPNEDGELTDRLLVKADKDYQDITTVKINGYRPSGETYIDNKGIWLRQQTGRKERHFFDFNLNIHKDMEIDFEAVDLLTAGKQFIQTSDPDIAWTKKRDTPISGTCRINDDLICEEINGPVLILRTRGVGDSNFDGRFNSGDVIRAFKAGHYEKETKATYEEGDWNRDGVFDSSDLVFALTHNFYT